MRSKRKVCVRVRERLKNEDEWEGKRLGMTRVVRWLKALRAGSVRKARFKHHKILLGFCKIPRILITTPEIVVIRKVLRAACAVLNLSRTEHMCLVTEV